MSNYWGVGRLLATSSVATSTAANSTAVISAQVHKVRVVTTDAAYIAIGTAPVAASTSGTYMPANSPEYFTIVPGERVSFVQATASAVGFVTEIG